MAGYNNHSFDIGFKPSNRYILGDKVWIDSDKDGIQDSNEIGIKGVTVNLYNNSTCSGNAIAHTVTNSNGYYNFTNLLSGSYCIEFSNIHNEYNITLPNQGSNNNLDSDSNSNAQITHINLTNNDNTEDIGIYYTPTVLDTTASCSCSPYTSKSVTSLNLFSIFILILLTISTTFIILKNEL